MNDLRQEPNDLLAYWIRYDWRESFFAPGISILQALTAAGRTASGAGSTRESAFRRCLGETAELYALQELDEQIDTSMVGIAAHIDAGKAQGYAMLEAFERFAAHEWWYGRRAAAQVPDTWLQQIGLTSHLLQARHGAALKRRTAWWRIKTDADCPHVMICRSMSPEGQNLILGFGAAACPARAARKALREAFLMEMNLMELLAARNSGVSDPLRVVGEKIATYGRRCPALLPPGADWAPPWHEAAEISIDGARNWFGGEAELRDITPQGGPINVWICRPILAHHDDDAGTGLPYL